MEKNVQLKYRLYRRRNGIFYCQENGSKNQGTLRTRDKRAAEKILHAMNESQRQPTLNLSIARAYLAAHDPKMSQRTWPSSNERNGDAREAMVPLPRWKEEQSQQS